MIDYGATPQTVTLVDLDSEYISEITSSHGSDGFRIWWIETLERPGGWPSLDRLYYCTFNNGVAGTPVLVHDEQADPSFPDEVFQFMHDMSEPVEVGGKYHFVMALEYTGLCVSFFWSYPLEPAPGAQNYAYFGQPVAARVSNPFAWFARSALAAA